MTVPAAIPRCCRHLAGWLDERWLPSRRPLAPHAHWDACAVRAEPPSRGSPRRATAQQLARSANAKLATCTLALARGERAASNEIPGSALIRTGLCGLEQSRR